MRRLALLPLLLLLASCIPEPVPNPLPAPLYDAAVPDGTVIFWMGGPLAKPILRNTNSDITHAAIILYQQGEPWVYEAVPPRVRKVPLAEYRQLMEVKLHERHPTTWFLMRPRIAYTTNELAAMRTYAERQLGRPYMLRGWWKGHEVRGIFCSQLIGDILEQSGRVDSAHTSESPGSLHDKLLPTYENFVPGP